VTFRIPGVLDYDAGPSQILIKPHVGCAEWPVLGALRICHYFECRHHKEGSTNIYVLCLWWKICL